MTDRITNARLEAIVTRINEMTGSPLVQYTRRKNGKLVAHVGNYHISGAYGGVSLHRMATDGGGISDVLSCGHITKRELADRMYAYMAALTAVKYGDVKVKKSR